MSITACSRAGTNEAGHGGATSRTASSPCSAWVSAMPRGSSAAITRPLSKPSRRQPILHIWFTFPIIGCRHALRCCSNNWSYRRPKTRPSHRIGCRHNGKPHDRDGRRLAVRWRPAVVVEPRRSARPITFSPRPACGGRARQIRSGCRSAPKFSRQIGTGSSAIRFTLRHRQASAGPAVRSWLASAFEPVKRTVDDIQRDYRLLIAAVSARTKASILVLNRMSTSGYEDISAMRPSIYR